MNGSCLCKRVRYECDRLAGSITHCCCHTCRKAHAAAYTSTARVRREDFRWTQGEEFLTAFNSSPDKLRYFCSVCGSHLMAERPHQSHVILRVATLDDDPAQMPVSYIWCSHTVPWLTERDDVPHYEQDKET